MKLISTLTLFISISTSSFAQTNLCEKKSIGSKKIFQHLVSFIEKNPSKVNNFISDQIKSGQKIKTKLNEYTKITFNKPFKIEFQVYPESEIEILKAATADCGPQLKLVKGKIQSTGNHPLIENDLKIEKCPFEIETNEAFIQPTGTTYLAESGALSDAIAELNGESTDQNNLVGVGETGTLSESSYEKYSVQKGSIKIKLKRISKNKLRNPVKYTKSNKNKSKNSVTKNKDKKRFLAYNEKIKLKAGSQLNLKRKKSMKKTQTAELEVIDPSGL